MNFTEIFNGMVGRDFIIAFNDNFRTTNDTFLSILATLLYKVRSTDIKEFKVIEGVVSYTLEDPPAEGEPDTRSWTPVDVTQWGNITGNIADQTDLKTALDSKAAADTVADIDTILSTLNVEFNSLKDEYDATVVTVNANTNSIADLTVANATKVNSNDIKAIRVNNSTFEWTTDGTSWHSIAISGSAAWGTIVGDITSQTDLNTLITNINNNMSSLSDSVVNLSNLITTKSAEIDTLSSTVTALDTRLTADETSYSGSFNTINNNITALQNADTTISGNLSTHSGNTNNPHLVTKSQVGLGNVDNTSDANKPVSDAQRTYVQEQIAASIPDTSSFVVYNGSASKLFVGTTDDYEELDSNQKGTTLAFVLYTDWDASVIASLSVSYSIVTELPGGGVARTDVGHGDLILKNVSRGRFNNKIFSDTFTAQGACTLLNIPEGRYAINQLYVDAVPIISGIETAGIQFVKTTSRVTLNVESGSTLNIPSQFSDLTDDNYLDNLIIWLEDGLDIVSVETSDGERELVNANTTFTSTPLTDYHYVELVDPETSQDPDYVSGVALGVNYVFVLLDTTNQTQVTATRYVDYTAIASQPVCIDLASTTPVSNAEPNNSNEGGNE